jgi:iron complex transport system substrate-binding protein
MKVTMRSVFHVSLLCVLGASFMTDFAHANIQPSSKPTETSYLLSASPQSLNKNAPTERIVSAGGSVTEILFALSYNQAVKPHIVAIDTSSSFPAATQALPKVGYYRQLSVEGVLSARPTRVFAAKGAGPVNVLEQLEQAGVEVLLFEQAKTVQGLMALIEQIGAQAGLIDSAKQLLNNLQSQLNKLQQHRLSTKTPVVFLMSASERGLMAAGNNTVPHLVMELAGLDNPFGKLEGFKTISVESFLAIGPKKVLIAAHTTGGLSAQEMCRQPALKLWAAVHGCNVHLVDPLLFLGLTPRLPKAVETFIEIVSPSEQAGAR